jgi:ATP-dependent Lon protease
MGMARPERIPLFPLNVVLLPGGDLPLHIFEPRYREMAGNCLRDKSEFGMLLALPDGVVRVGCTAEILEVAKRYSDGRMDILTVGRAPFRVVEIFDENPLLEGKVEYLEDREASASSQMERELVELYEVCYTLIFDVFPPDLRKSGEAPLSYSIASALPLELLWKQQILELRQEVERQERLVAYLREWAPHLQKRETQRKRASGNGHGVN